MYRESSRKFQYGGRHSRGPKKTKLYVYASWRVRQDRSNTLHRKELKEYKGEKRFLWDGLPSSKKTKGWKIVITKQEMKTIPKKVKERICEGMWRNVKESKWTVKEVFGIEGKRKERRRIQQGKEKTKSYTARKKKKTKKKWRKREATKMKASREKNYNANK